jgi:hypothetical protein
MIAGLSDNKNGLIVDGNRMLSFGCKRVQRGAGLENNLF